MLLPTTIIISVWPLQVLMFLRPVHCLKVDTIVLHPQGKLHHLPDIADENAKNTARAQNMILGFIMHGSFIRVAVDALL